MIVKVPRWVHLLRAIPAGTRGKGRLSRMLLNHWLPDTPVEIEVGALRFRVPSAREPVAFHLIADGSYDGETAAVIARTLQPDGVFFDVGANIGALSLQSALKWCPAGRVVGFEASPTVKSYLETNAKLNGATNFTLMHRAVTAHSGDFLPFFEAPSSKFGMGSLANRFGTTEHRIPTITLDDAAAELGVSRVDVIKVDVEGFELGVFQGATGLLRQAPAPVIVFEFNDWAESRDGSKPGDAQRFLRDQGYHLQPIRDWLRGLPPTDAVMESGGDNLVAFK